MRMIISPAKTMRIANDDFAYRDLPVFLGKSKVLKERLQSMSLEECKKLWKCSEKLAKENYERIVRMNLHENLSPALFAYDGIQYTYMAADVMESGQLEYLQEHLRILSGFYGILKTFDGIVPYRLEMQAPLATEYGKNLYAFWKDDLYRELTNGDHVIVDLASKEYSQAVYPYKQEGDLWITCVFGTLVNHKVVQKGTFAKMARGEMVRYMAVNHCQTPEDLKRFTIEGYSYSKEYSDESTYVFLKEA